MSETSVPPQPGVALDRTGQVTARVDPDGGLEAIEVGFTWDEALTVEELPGAVLAAVAGARGQVQHEGPTDDGPGVHARSISGHAGATARGDGGIEALDLDPTWVERAHPEQLGEEITEAVRAATRDARPSPTTGR